MVKIFFFFPFLLSASLCFAQHYERPQMAGRHQVVHHYVFSLSYNEQHEQANWVAYELTANETIARYSRKDYGKFRADTAIHTGSASPADYKGSGYDRGHLAPAADMQWNDTALSESFLMSNISPQQRSFNAGQWKKLEEAVRHWAQCYGSIYVATGPLLHDSLPTIGANKVSVPQYFYKVLLVYTPQIHQSVGFIIPNEKIQKPLSAFICPVDEVERFSGIDFFYALPDHIEEKIESAVDTLFWAIK